MKYLSSMLNKVLLNGKADFFQRSFKGPVTPLRWAGLEHFIIIDCWTELIRCVCVCVHRRLQVRYRCIRGWTLKLHSGSLQRLIGVRVQHSSHLHGHKRACAAGDGCSNLVVATGEHSVSSLFCGSKSNPEPLTKVLI